MANIKRVNPESGISEGTKRVNPESKAVKPVKWKPGSRLGTALCPKGYRMRWCEDTPENIEKKKSDRWEILDKTKFPDLGSSEFDRRVTDSEGLTKSILKRNELVAMIMPEEVAQARDEYHREQTRLNTQQALSAQEAKRLIGQRNVKPIIAGVSVID